MEQYTYQQIIDELKSLYTQARSVNAQAKIAQRVVNSADSFKTRKSNELSSLETKVDSVDGLLDSSLANSLSQLDSIKRDAYKRDLEQIKAKLSALSTRKVRLTDLNQHVDSNEYQLPSINQDPTMTLLTNMIQTMINSIQNTFSDVYTGSKYLGIIDEVTPTDAPYAEIVQAFSYKLVTFDILAGNLTTAVNEYLTVVNDAVLEERAMYDLLIASSIALDSKKAVRDAAIANGESQEIIDAAEAGLLSEKTAAENNAKDAKKFSINKEAAIFAKSTAIEMLVVPVDQMATEVGVYYDANQQILVGQYGDNINIISDRIMDIISPIFSKVTDFSGYADGLSNQFLIIFNNLKNDKAEWTEHKRSEVNGNKLGVEPFSMYNTDGWLDPKFSDYLCPSPQDKQRVVNAYNTYCATFGGAIETISRLAAEQETRQQILSAFDYVVSEYGAAISELRVANIDKLMSAFNSYKLANGVKGTTPEEVSMWHDAKLGYVHAYAEYDAAEYRYSFNLTKMTFLRYKYPEFGALYTQLVQSLNDATYGDVDTEAAAGFQQSIDQLLAEYPEAQEVAQDIADYDQIIIGNDVSQRIALYNQRNELNDAFVLLDNTLGWVDSTFADKMEARKLTLGQGNAYTKYNFYVNYLNGPLSTYANQMIGSLQTCNYAINSYSSSIPGVLAQAMSNLQTPGTSAWSDLIMPWKQRFSNEGIGQLKQHKADMHGDALHSLCATYGLLLANAPKRQSTPYDLSNISGAVQNLITYSVNKGNITDLAAEILSQVNNS